MLAALLLAAAAAQTPQAFVTQLYARYRNESFSPFNHIDAIFAPRLAAAIKLDRRLAQGEIGALDHDPVCLCQDASGLRAEILHVASPAPDRAVVSMMLRYDGSPHIAPTRLTLQRLHAGWRIADLSDQGSLLAYLDHANRETIKHLHRR